MSDQLDFSTFKKKPEKTSDKPSDKVSDTMADNQKNKNELSDNSIKSNFSPSKPTSDKKKPKNNVSDKVSDKVSDTMADKNNLKYLELKNDLVIVQDRLETLTLQMAKNHQFGAEHNLPLTKQTILDLVVAQCTQSHNTYAPGLIKTLTESNHNAMFQRRRITDFLDVLLEITNITEKDEK
jgi:hypothetical protein